MSIYSEQSSNRQSEPQELCLPFTGDEPQPSDEILPFTLEEPEIQAAMPAGFKDDEVQQAEADGAPAALAGLQEPEEPENEEEEETEAEVDDDEELPASETKTPEPAAPSAPAISEEQKRTEYEAAEAKRKAEWDAKQAAKKEAEQAALDNLAAMDDDAAMKASMKRVSTDTEKLTRRNMKDCVSEQIQTKCLEDPAFARLVMHPRKSMIHCFYYINRKAREFVEQEMKDNDTKPENGVYGSDVPDDLCYQWAEDYFRDADAKEDKEKDEEFVPKPYSGKKPAKKPAKKAAKKPTPTKAESKKPEDNGQMSLMEEPTFFDMLEEAKAV